MLHHASSSTSRTILIVLVLRTMEAFKVFDVMTLGGPANGTETIAFSTYIQAFPDQLFGHGAALAYIIAFFQRYIVGSLSAGAVKGSS